MAPAMPCKTSKACKHGETRGKNEIKSKLACIWEASESTRLRMEEESPANHHEDHIAGKGDNSPQHYILVHKINSYTSSHKDSRSKSSSGLKMGETGKDSGVEPDESQK